MCRDLGGTQDGVGSRGRSGSDWAGQGGRCHDGKGDEARPQGLRVVAGEGWLCGQ